MNLKSQRASINDGLESALGINSLTVGKMRRMSQSAYIKEKLTAIFFKDRWYLVCGNSR